MGVVQAIADKMEVAGVYSQPMIAGVAGRVGIRAGGAFDIATCDGSSQPWDFTMGLNRRWKWYKLLVKKPDNSRESLEFP